MITTNYLYEILIIQCCKHFCNYYKFFFGYLSRLLQHTQLNYNNYHNTIEKKWKKNWSKNKNHKLQRRTVTTLNSNPHTINRIPVPQNVLVKIIISSSSSIPMHLDIYPDFPFDCCHIICVLLNAFLYAPF